MVMNKAIFRTLTTFAFAVTVLQSVSLLAQQTYCTTALPPKKESNTPPPPQCKCPKKTSAVSPSPDNLCTGSPCYAASGSYETSSIDLSMPTAGYPLSVARLYESVRPIDGVLGIGWTLNLSAHLYYASYLYAAPSTLQKEADVILPDGWRYEYTENSDGSFNPPNSRYDNLVRNSDGTFDLTALDDSSTTHYHFSPAGQLQSMSDEFGNTLSFTYDEGDRLQHVADDGDTGRYLDLYYGADGRISTIQDQSGRMIQYSYAAGGTLTAVTDPVGRITSYDYQSVRFGSLLTQIRDHWGRTLTEVTYDDRGRTRSYTREGETFTYTYEYEGHADQTAKEDSLGHRWIYTFAGDGVIVQREQPGALSEHTTYNTDRTIATSTDETGVMTTYTYAGQGRIASVTRDAVSPQPQRYEYTYDAAFPTKVATVTAKKWNATTQLWEVDPDWQSWRYDYFAAGSPAPGALAHAYRVRSDGVTTDTVTAHDYDSQGRILSSTDAAGSVTTYSYDFLGNLSTLRRPANNASGTQPITTYQYDDKGRVARVTTPDHDPSSLVGYDLEYVYDELDRITAVHDHFAVTVRLPRCVGEVCDPGGTFITFAQTLYAYDRYDASTGLVFTDVTDPNQNVTHQGYDVYGRMVQSIDALGNTTSYGYTTNHLTSITDANGNVTHYGYDPLGRLELTTFPDGAVERYAYTPDGMLAGKTDRKNQTIGYTYDHLKRLITKTYPGGTSVQYTYTGQKLTQVTDTTLTPNETHTFAYDSAYRVASNTQANRGTIQYTYTPTDAVATSAVGGAASTAYTYYPDGSLSTIQWSPVSGTFQYSYRLGGAYDTITFPNGQTRSYTYDRWGRLTQVANVHPSAGNLATYAYDYDQEYGTGAPGNRLDQRTRMTASVPAQGLNAVPTQYHYDEAYQLIRVDNPAGGASGWAYDAIGNRIVSSQSACYSCPVSSTLYTYQTVGGNPNNWQRLLSVNGPSQVKSYTYDANGNVTSTTTNGETVTFAWDPENRPTAVAGGSPLTQTYDYRGRRTRDHSGTVLENSSFYDGLNLIGQGRSGFSQVLSEEFVFGPGIDEPLAMSSPAGVYYYSVDALGSVALVTDAAGAAGTSGMYGPWGELIDSGGALANQPFWYAGRELGWNDILYYRARYYEPGTGRFLSEDPLRYFIGPNFYPYVRNNPVILRDPFGLDGDVVQFPGNPKPPPEWPSCFDSPDVRDFHDPAYNWRNAPRQAPPIRFAVRAAIVVTLAAVNIAVWNCVIAQAYCATQNDYCDCMKYANPSGYCTDIFGGGCSRPRPIRTPPPSPTCDLCPRANK